MDTTIVKISNEILNSNIPSIQYLVKQRTTPLKDWLIDPELSLRLSGTLKKNAKIGFKHMDQLKHEAICQTLGWSWEVVPSSRITYNDAISEGDSKSLTEVGWFADRWLSQHIFSEDYYELKYIIHDGENGRREGVGLICRNTSIQWIKNSEIIFCFLAEFDDMKKEWKEAINPF